jgi:hypothetical protein
MIAIHLKEISGGRTVRFDYFRGRTPGRAGKNFPPALSGSFKG